VQNEEDDIPQAMYYARCGRVRTYLQRALT
jgi:hypothetical protein